MRPTRHALLWSTAVALAVLAAGCKPSLIPGTNVEDTDENRRVIEFLGKYREAIVQKSPDRVVGLCAPDYFEDNGTPDQDDDYGLAELRQKLEANFARTKEIQLEIIVQKIERAEERDAPVKVAFRYNQRALIDFPAGQKWITITDVNRLVLRPDAAGGYLIASGL
jgi:hypothetical protein